MVEKVNFIEYVKSLKGLEPPYKCPSCEKQYKSVIGLQYHQKSHYSSVSPGTPAPGVTPKKRKKTIHTPKAPPVPAQQEQGITYEANNLVFKINGKIIPLPINEEFPTIDLQVYEKMTSHSNYEIETIEPPKEPEIKLPEAIFRKIENYNICDAPAKPNSYIRFIEKSAEELDGEVEYDLDEEDTTWLTVINEKRDEQGVNAIDVDTLELLIDRLEKESFFQAASNGQMVAIVDEDAICCICMDGECQNTNVILFCDMCNLAVHQDCYGVPYIPEGQWLCRRCLQSPSKPVECVLCPNSGGAFKQTDRGHWSHVVCALWIPEVRFANTVFLEPIDSIETIPPARWRLTCYICKQKGIGACIQCNKNYCYSAFHVTCAQYAGLCMRMETVKMDEAQPTIQKLAFCDQHTPSNFGIEKSPVENEKTKEENRNKMKQARKLLAKKRSSAPVILIPTIPAERIQEISSMVNVQKKSQFIQRLIAYWTLKRQYRNGVPLLRRLQSSQTNSSSRNGLEGSPDARELYKQLKYWQTLRQDLERARLLCELVRKREKLKLLSIKTNEECLMSQLNPLGSALAGILTQLVAKDTLEIFLDPVDVNEVPDYANVIKNPIDLGTMKEKLGASLYSSLEEFEADFHLMIRNCLLYNDKETIFYRAGIKMKEFGNGVFRQTRRELEKSGMLAPPIADAEIIKNMNSEMEEILSVGPTVDGLQKLEKLMVKTNSIKHHLSKAKKVKIIKNEMVKMQKLLKNELKKSMTMTDDSQSDGEGSKTSASITSDMIMKMPELKTPPTTPLKSSALNTTSPSNPGVNRRNAILFTRKQQAIPKRPEFPKEDNAGSHLDVDMKLDEARTLSPGKTSKKGVGRGRKGSSRKSADRPSDKKSLLLAPAAPNPNITLETPKFDHKIPEIFRVYRGQGSGSENSDNSDGFSDTGSSGSGFSESYTNSEFGSSCDDRSGVSDSEILSENNSDSETLPPEKQNDDSQNTSSTKKQDVDDGESDNSNDSDDVGNGASKESTGLKPLQLVWAKCRGYPSYPALIIPENIPKGFVHNSVPLPKPPQHVLQLRKNNSDDEFLVLFFDVKRTWQWLPPAKLELLGIDKVVDESKLSESRKPQERKAVRKAYSEAVHYQLQVSKNGKPEGKL